jgi:hypothetical protein
MGCIRETYVLYKAYLRRHLRTYLDYLTPNDYLGSYIMLISVMHVSVNNCIYNM